MYSTRVGPLVFAKGTLSRDDIVRWAADLGVELDEHIRVVIDAMAGIADELGLGGRNIYDGA